MAFPSTKNAPVWDLFRSFYTSSTHIDPVNLKEILPIHFCKDQPLVKTAQKVASLPGIQELLSAPALYDQEKLKDANKTFQERGFTLLGERNFLSFFGNTVLPSYTVSTHPELQHWVIKSAGQRTPDQDIASAGMNDQGEVGQMTAYDSLLRPIMADRIRQIAHRLGMDIAIPTEYVVPFADVQEDTPLLNRYFIMSEKLNIKTKEETIAHIQNLSTEKQIELAHQMSLLTKSIGFLDSTFNNWRFTYDGKLALIDTEPAGLMKATDDSNRKQGHTVEKCARIGLFQLKTHAEQLGLKEFARTVNHHYQKSLKEVSITRIVLSILCPLLPLVVLIMALFKKARIENLGKTAAQHLLGMNSAATDDQKKTLKSVSRKILEELEGVQIPLKTA